MPINSIHCIRKYLIAQAFYCALWWSFIFVFSSSSDGSQNDKAQLFKVWSQSKVSEGLSGIAIDLKRNRIITPTQSGKTIFWNLQNGKRLGHIHHDKQIPTCIKLHPSGDRMALGFWNGSVREFDLMTNMQVASWKPHKESILDLHYFRSGNQLASTSSDDTASIWDRSKGKNRFENENEYDMTCMALSPDEKFLVTGDGENRVLIWDIMNGEEWLSLEQHQQSITRVLWHKENGWIISASWDGKVIIWDSNFGTPINEFSTSQGEINDMTLDPTNNILFSAGEDKTVKMWNIRSGEQASTPVTLKAPVKLLRCFKRADKSFTVIASQNHISLWHIK